MLLTEKQERSKMIKWQNLQRNTVTEQAIGKTWPTQTVKQKILFLPQVAAVMWCRI
jgi:hypothetical protein